MALYLIAYALLAGVGLLLPGRAPLVALLGIGTVLVLFMGFREDVGCDYASYEIRYHNHLEVFSWQAIQQQDELGFAVLSAVMRDLGASYAQFLVLVSAILVACYVTFVRAHQHGLLILALLFPVVILQLGMSGIRQALAGGFLMVASVPFLRGQRIATGAWIVLGAQFHVSAIIFLPLALLAGRTASLARIGAALVVLGPLAVVLLGERFDTYSDRYIEQVRGEIVSNGAFLRYGLIMIPVVAMAVYHRNLRQRAPEVFPLLHVFALIAVVLGPIGMLSSIALHRLGYYVMPFSILTFVVLTDVAFKTGQHYLARLLPVLVYGGYSTLWFATSSHAYSCYIPYQSGL